MSWVAFIRSLSLPLQWWVTVAPWEQGVRVRRGKTAKRLDAGLHFKVPFLDRVYIVATRKRMIEDKGLTVTTADGHVVTISVVVQYAVADVLRLFETIANPESTILGRVEAALSKYVREVAWIDLKTESLCLAGVGAVPGGEWGLSDVDVQVTTFARVRTYRFMTHEYRNTGSLDQTLSSDEDRRLGR